MRRKFLYAGTDHIRLKPGPSTMCMSAWAWSYPGQVVFRGLTHCWDRWTVLLYREAALLLTETSLPGIA